MWGWGVRSNVLRVLTKILLDGVCTEVFVNGGAVLEGYSQVFVNTRQELEGLWLVRGGRRTEWMRLRGPIMGWCAEGYSRRMGATRATCALSGLVTSRRWADMYDLNPRQVVRAIREQDRRIGGGPQALQAIFEAEGALVPPRRCEELLTRLRGGNYIEALHEIFEEEGAKVPRRRVRSYVDALKSIGTLRGKP